MLPEAQKYNHHMPRGALDATFAPTDRRVLPSPATENHLKVPPAHVRVATYYNKNPCSNLPGSLAETKLRFQTQKYNHHMPQSALDATHAVWQSSVKHRQLVEEGRHLPVEVGHLEPL